MKKMQVGMKTLPMVAAVSILLSACGGGDAVPSSESSAPITFSTTMIEEPPATTTVPEIETVSAYFVGNSLTNGTLGPISQGVRSYVVLARQADYLFRPLGWHIKCGSSLASIAANPDDTCVDPAPDSARFSEALTDGDWDFLVVQPYPGSGSTLATDIEAIGDMAGLVAEDTTVLVFTGWPENPGFNEQWNASEPVGDESPTTHSGIYFDTLLSHLENVLDQEVRLIPTGEVLYRVQPQLVAGAVPGLVDLADLYSDEVHLNHLGNWLSGVTAASVMTGVGPDEFGKPYAPWYGDSSDFSKEYIQLVRAVVTAVLSE